MKMIFNINNPKKNTMKIDARFFKMIFFAVFCLVSSTTFSFAESEDGKYVITIKNHWFSPQELIIPANTKVKIVLDNQDPTPEEFESHDLNREKLVTGNNKAIIFIGPLKPGTYKYLGEFHEKTAQGTIVVE